VPARAGEAVRSLDVLRRRRNRDAVGRVTTPPSSRRDCRMTGRHERPDDGRDADAAPSLPETVARERAAEEAADTDSATSIASTERRGRRAHDEDGSLPATEGRERANEQEADAEQARSDTPSTPGTEYRERE
jgi:hypothetical protein